MIRKPALEGGKPVREHFLPFSRPTIGQEEISSVVECLRSGWLTTGTKNFQFEDSIRKYLGCKYAVALDSCTSALNLSLAVNNIGPGDEVITTPLTFVSTINVIVHRGAHPVLADIDEETYNINPESVKKAITQRTRAIIPVHFGGYPCEMDELVRIAHQGDILLIEDAAHALGSEYKGKKIGIIGHLTCFSFYVIKNITTGEGGMVVTDNKEWEEKIRCLRFHGISKDAWKRYSKEGSWYYDVPSAGYKNNLTDIQAAIGIEQMKKLDSFITKREYIATRYSKAFKKIPGIIIPEVRKDVKHSWHLFPVRIDKHKLGIDRDKFITVLSAENIGTSVHFIPIHYHSFYKQNYGYKHGDFPSCEKVYSQIVSLPIYPEMQEQDINDVIEAIEKIVSFYGNT